MFISCNDFFFLKVFYVVIDNVVLVNNFKLWRMVSDKVIIYYLIESIFLLLFMNFMKYFLML